MGGLTSNTCLESSARYAYELQVSSRCVSDAGSNSARGYHVTLLKDATAGFSTAQKDAATELIWPLFAHEVLTVAEWIGTM